jgi:uncharacterized ferredoxin-like protein
MKCGIRSALDLMAIAARTAPKAKGQDFLVITVVKDEEKLVGLGKAMEEYGAKTGKKNFDRDGRNVAASDGLLLVGLSGAASVGLNCGACGHSRCADREARQGPEFSGPQCALRELDLGIALGSAVKSASMLNLDNRIMYRAGVVAIATGMIEADVAMGIPISVSGKSIYFDRT